MTRGKIIYIDKNEIMYCSCEFNGDMHPEHKGDQIIENFQNGNFKSVTDYEKYVERFNDRNFGYDDISIRCIELEKNEWCIDDNYTDYLYIINGSESEFFIIQKDEKSVIPMNGIGIVRFHTVEEILSPNYEEKMKKLVIEDGEAAAAIDELKFRGKLRDIRRIEPLIEEFKVLWEKHPDLRFGQLVCNIMPEDKLYYVEDDIMLDKIKKWGIERRE